MLRRLPELGLDLEALTGQLEAEGVQKFIEPFTKMLDSVEKKRQQTLLSSQQLA